MNKKTVDDIQVKGKKVLVRCDFNVPIQDGVITDETRIVGALPTIKKLVDEGAKVILCSHMGKPKGEAVPSLSLAPVAKKLSEHLGKEVVFAADANVVGENAKAAVAAMNEGDVVLLENTRYRAEETKNVDTFSEELASLAEIFVNDAFGTAHRRHASTAVIADYFDADHKMLGYLMEKEVKAVDNILKDIKRPFTAIMGGSKVSTKIGIIENLMDKVDNLILCGGMTYTFAKAMGGKVGNSICETDKLDLALDIMAKAKAKGVNLVLGTDCIAADAFSNDAHTMVCSVMDIPEGWEGLDAGPETRKLFADTIVGSKTILWNGPAGVFEFDNFTGGSRAIADAVVAATKNGAFSLVGGGDSVACINKFGLADEVSYVSTGGGALLEAIEGKVLPGVAAIEG